MSNNFIRYLNSTNNAGSDTVGALAEAQVKTPYYNKIKVNRKLGTYISDNIKKGNHMAYILTGHAGDGKTSILVQVLKNLNLLCNGEGLEEEKEYTNAGGRLYYIKDMSEIGEEKQNKVLAKTLNAPLNDSSSLLITNTGPLLKTFELLVKQNRSEFGQDFNEEDRIALQTKILDQLDKNDDGIIEVANYKFILVNIARIDNVAFSKKILLKIIQDELWTPCSECNLKGKCPMFFNKEHIKDNFDRVSAFVESFYRHLYENDKRMTIRQMLGHLSYALTGNLSCETVKNKMFKNPFFDYNCANLFFGNIGLNDGDQAAQIKGIEQIKNSEIDKIALDIDYKLFVNNDFSDFSIQIKEILENVLKSNRKLYKIIEEDDVESDKIQQAEIQLRKAFRRFYLVYSSYDEIDKVIIMLNQVFGRSFSDYVKLISGKQANRSYIKHVQSTVYNALYLKNTGFLPDSQISDLPLTLRREDDVFQNVMLVVGSVNKKDILIMQKKMENQFEDYNEKYALVLKVDENEYPLSLPLINYFDTVIEGAIASNNNPSLTHGIAKLDAMLHEKFKSDDEDGEMSVLVNTTNGQKRYTYAFGDNKITID
jgi:hypothetical protein